MAKDNAELKLTKEIKKKYAKRKAEFIKNRPLADDSLFVDLLKKQTIEKSAIGVLVVQGQNQMTNPSTGFTYFPNEAEEFIIKNNIISGLNGTSANHERSGIKITTVKAVGSYKTRGDVIINNTIILDDDGQITRGDLTGIYLDGSIDAKILNNAIAILDEEIWHDSNPSIEHANALIYYAGIMPGQQGGLVSNRNAFWKIEKGDPADKSGLAVYGFKEYAPETEEWLPYNQDDYETLRQWRNWTEQDYNSIISDFTGDYTYLSTKPNRELRINVPYPKGSVLNNRGFNYSEYLTTDIGGKKRGEAASLYDIGACEFNGSLYLQDMEVKTISEPSTYQAGLGMFSDAEYLMTSFPLDCKVVIRNSGSLDQSGVEIILRIYRENASGVFTDDALDTIKAYADVVTSESVEVSFNLPAIEAAKDDTSKLFVTYSDLRGSIPAYIIPAHFRGDMEANVTPRYKFEIEIRPDENNSNNTASTIARFYVKRSNELNLMITAENTDTDIYNTATDPGNEVESGKLNFDRLSYGFSRLAWFTNINVDIMYEDDDMLDSMKIDVFNRNSWEPKSVDYTNYKLLFWSDGHDKPLTRYEKWNLSAYLAEGVIGNKKNLVVSSQEIVTANSFKWVGPDLVEDQTFVNNVLRCMYNDELTPWATGTDGHSVLGEDFDRDQIREIEKTPVLRYDWNTDGNSNNTVSDDPMPMCALMDPYTTGPGLARRAYTYIDNDGQRTEFDSTMGVSTVILEQNLVVLGVDWRHWKDIESIIRAAVDYIDKNDGFAIPVELLSFDAQAVANKVQISWSTASEINSDRFEVERAEMVNGMKTSFETIATVSAAGKSTETINYDPVFDTDVTLGNSYIYRLAMVDADGVTDYSLEVLVDLGTALVLDKPTPSPASSQVTFRTNADANATVTVFNSNGKTFVPEYTMVSGQIVVDLNNMASGIYTIVVKTNNEMTTRKFTVVK